MSFAAVALRDITPSRPAYLGGYASRTEPVETILDPLLLRVIALRDQSGTELIIVTLDLVDLPRSLSEKIYQWAKSVLALEREQLLLNVAHTHCAPILANHYYQPNWHVDENYVQRVVSAICDAIVEVRKSYAPTVIRYGELRYRFGINRRLPAGNKIEMRPNESGCYDDRIPVFMLEQNGQTRAILYSIGCHPTSRGGQYISADYPGAIARNFPDYPACFLQGAAGSAKPRLITSENNTFHAASQAELDDMGRHAADAIKELLSSSQMQEIQLEIQSRCSFLSLPLDMNKALTKSELNTILNHPASLPYERASAQYFLAAIERDSLTKSCELELRYFRLSRECALLTLSAEVTAEVAELLRQALEKSGQSLLILGYTSFCAAYLPTAAMLAEGGYEALESQQYYQMSAPFTSEIDQLLLKHLQALI